MEKLRPHIQYLRYLVRHKYFVFVEGRKLGVGLLRLLVHDWSKFLPSEWFPYAAHFYGDRPVNRGGDSGYDRSHDLEDEDFNIAWLKHVNRNPHHWQFWCLLFDDGGGRSLTMPHKYRKEMLADWRGAGRALGQTDTAKWYRANKTNMQLHPETRAWIEEQIGDAR